MKTHNSHYLNSSVALLCCIVYLRSIENTTLELTSSFLLLVVMPCFKLDHCPVQWRESRQMASPDIPVPHSSRLGQGHVVSSKATGHLTSGGLGRAVFRFQGFQEVDLSRANTWEESPLQYRIGSNMHILLILIYIYWTIHDYTGWSSLLEVTFGRNMSV